ncbi:MAG TPA: TIGR00180 family glycosyltransferase [Hyphomicrobiaceae bacterium]|nr:TIGR00180 family glycosyltransferase [Hyphomicrobiaceae bacterium]
MAAALTIVIPTYNRPADLGRLVRYIGTAIPAARAVVLDSSRGDAATGARSVCLAHPTVTYRSYPPEARFYEKLADGIDRFVDTDAVCLCADDDLLVGPGILDAARVIETDQTVAVAHGYYAQFTLHGGGGRLTGLGTIAPASTSSDPMARIAEGLLSYEATLYAVHRRELLIDILKEASSAPSLLSAELLTCVLALSAGRMHRVQAFTHARSIAPSHGYSHWHPAEALAVDPARLGAGLAFVRSRLLARHPELPDTRLRVFDLALFAYVASYVQPGTARRIARMAIEGAGDQQRLDVGWSAFTASLQPTRSMSAVRGSAPARWVKSRLAGHPEIRERLLRLMRNGARHVPTEGVKLADGRLTTIALEAGFTERLASIPLAIDAPATRSLVEAMAIYSEGLLKPAPKFPEGP